MNRVFNNTAVSVEDTAFQSDQPPLMLALKKNIPSLIPSWYIEHQMFWISIVFTICLLES